MQKTTNEKLKLGIFVIIGLLIFIVAIYFIGQRQNIFAKTFSISTNFNNVNGLINGNNVRYSGINVGTVKSITIINDSTINVVMLIEEKMINHIKKDAIATIGTDGLVGNMIVNIIPGDGINGPISSGDVIKSYTKIGTSDKLLKIADAMADSKGTFGMLINDTMVSSNLKQTVKQLRITSIEASKSMKELNSIISSINFNKSIAGTLLNDSLQSQKMKNIITNLENSSTEIKDVITNMNATITNVKEGEGALNYLSNDAEFVNSLKETIKNINEGTDKFNQNMEALKHNFLTRSYFRKLERQEKKEDRKQKD